ncbi:tripartite tricarboxylate transporter substrate binding protein [Alcaligenaceae bacterium A4P071]|nr:tripartite tricarboxylate transporter substrate binding protein [Alcaligenaceae bacterium A4P071]
MNARFILRLTAQAAACLALTQPLAAFAAFPERPLQMVIPFPAGGATDVLGRLVAAELGNRLGQTVVVENRAGAGTSIGAGYVAKAKPDGYTLMLTSTTTFTVNPAIYKNLPYDPTTSYDAIGQVGSTGLMLLANKNAPAKDLKAFVDQAKAEPGKVFYGSFGSGTTAHFAAEMLASAAGITLTHVPYKGSSPAMTDLIGGQIPYSVDTTAAAIPQVKAGTVRAIVTTAPTRSALLPDVPTAAESGYPEAKMDTWLAVVGPRGLPADARATLEKALAEIVADPAFQKKMAENGFEPDYANGAAVDARIQRDVPVMKALAEKAKIQID